MRLGVSVFIGGRGGRTQSIPYLLKPFSNRHSLVKRGIYCLLMYQLIRRKRWRCCQYSNGVLVVILFASGMSFCVCRSFLPHAVVVTYPFFFLLLLCCYIPRFPLKPLRIHHTNVCVNIKTIDQHVLIRGGRVCMCVRVCLQAFYFLLGVLLQPPPAWSPSTPPTTSPFFIIVLFLFIFFLCFVRRAHEHAW